MTFDSRCSCSICSTSLTCLTCSFPNSTLKFEDLFPWAMLNSRVTSIYTIYAAPWMWNTAKQEVHQRKTKEQNHWCRETFCKGPLETLYRVFSLILSLCTKRALGFRNLVGPEEISWDQGQSKGTIIYRIDWIDHGTLREGREKSARLTVERAWNLSTIFKHGTGHFLDGAIVHQRKWRIIHCQGRAFQTRERSCKVKHD